MTAKITDTVPDEPPGYQFNNATDHWIMVAQHHLQGSTRAFSRYTNSDTGVRIFRISDQLPQAGGATTFTVGAFTVTGDTPGGTFDEQDHAQLDVQVRISLSPGLAFAPTQQPPGNTTFNPSTGIWDIGELRDGGITRPLEFPVAVDLTNYSLVDLPLEERCLTAEVVRAVPWWEFVPSKRENDIRTTCLGEPKLLVTGGDFVLFDFYPCVGVTSGPCTSADTLELLATVDPGIYANPSIDLHGRDFANARTRAETISLFSPEQLVVQVPTWARGEETDGKPVWSTEDPFDLEDSQERLPEASWSAAREDLTVTGPGGGPLPGTFTMDFPSDTSLNVEITDTTKFTGTSFDTGYDIAFDLHFGALGTYVLTMDIRATHTTAGVLTDSATYTFHVGPVADLEVRDAGASPEAGGSQRAYTVVAVNNGPQTAAAVEVTLTGVPQGAQAIASEGDYDSATGVWTISELRTPDIRRSTGLPEGPTLTLVTAGANPGPITATIENTEDNCVRIKKGDTDPENDLDCVGSLPTGYTEHSAAYYDYVTDNNTATVQAHAGTGAGAPGAPRSLILQPFGTGALLRWEPVERLNGFPVTHYHVERSGVTVATDVMENTYVDLQGNVNQPYRVRAVNEFGVPGPWSSPAGTAGSLNLTAAPAYGEGRIDLIWLPPSTSDSLRYRIEHSRDGRTWQVLVESHSGTTYTHDGLPLETTHYYRVTAMAGIVTIAQALAGATTDAAVVPGAGTVPAPPENLRFSSLERTSVTLVWDPPSDDGGTPVTGYDYEVSGPCGGGGDGCVVVTPTRVSGTSRRISGLDLEGTYDFRVRAVNAAGTGDWSWSVQKTVGPPAAAGGRVILSPAALTVPEGSDASYRVKLSRQPTQPLSVGLFWDGDTDLSAGLASQQFKVLLPSGYDTSGLADVECPHFPGLFAGGWTYAWNVGVPITVWAAEDADSENGRLIIEHDISTVPAACLGNPAGYAPDPVYDGMFGIALEVTERDND